MRKDPNDRDPTFRLSQWRGLIELVIGLSMIAALLLGALYVGLVL